MVGELHPIEWGIRVMRKGSSFKKRGFGLSRSLTLTVTSETYFEYKEQAILRSLNNLVVA